MFYQLVYDNYNRKKSIWKTILLTVAILLDFINIYNIVSICLGDLLSIIYLIVLIILATVFRIIAINLCYSYRVTYYKDIFTILKVLPLKQKELLTIRITDINISTMDKKSVLSDKNTKNTTIIIDNNDLLVYYSIATANHDNNKIKRYILPLDNYMYYLLSLKSNERGNNDLLR